MSARQQPKTADEMIRMRRGRNRAAAAAAMATSVTVGKFQIPTNFPDGADGMLRHEQKTSTVFGIPHHNDLVTLDANYSRKQNAHNKTQDFPRII